MRRFVRRAPVVVAAVVLAVTGTAVGGAAYVMRSDDPDSKRVSAPQANRSGVTSVMPPAGRSAAFQRVVPPDFLIVADKPLSAGRLARLGRLQHVRDVITVDAGAVQLQGGRVNMFAVDPSSFRSWTPPSTARNDKLWNALTQHRFVTSRDVQSRLGLRADMPYYVQGRAQLQVTMGGSGSLGLPGINVLVDRPTGMKIGLVQDIGLLVNAPGADLRSLQSDLRDLVGEQSQIINLHQTRDQTARTSGSGRASSYLDLYRQAAGTCPGLSWTVLAAIGQIESGHGRNIGPSSAGALGPMQFMPATWRTYGVDGDHDGKADIMNPYDAVPTAARYLCANGAGHGGAQLSQAIWHYNHSMDYVNSVLALSRAYASHYS